MVRYRLIAALAVVAALAWPTAAYSVCTGQFTAGQVCGNGGSALAPPTGTGLSALFDRNFGAPSAQGTILNRGASTWGATISPVIGNPGASTGGLGIASSAGGTATIASPGVASNTNFKLPPNNGTTNYVLITDGAGNTSWAPNSTGGTVTSVGLVLPTSIFLVTVSPITTAGSLTAVLQTQSANLVLAGPTTGAVVTPTFRSLVGADLPNPTTSSLGGIQAVNAVSHQWVHSINSSGVPQLSQPAFSDISGSITPAQCPNPSASTIGCVESYAAVSHQWIIGISTAGVPSSTQPAFTDISGSLTAAQLPVIGNNSVLANISGGSTFPTATGISALIDATIGNVQGDILYRNATGWVVLPPGTSGQALETGGAAANPSWVSISGTGTVTSIATNNGLTGGTITTAGTIGLANISAGTILANVTGGSTFPTPNTPSAVLDIIDNTEGDILYRGASVWAVLPAGVSGQVLQTQGAGSTPQWANAGGVSSVGITAGTNIGVTGTCTITTSGTCTIALATTLTGSLTLSGTDNFTGTFQVGGNTMTFPGLAATLLAANVVDQTVTGGANINPATNGNLGTGSGTVTLDCGKVSVQYITNNAAFTLAAPANDSQCTLYVLNGASAGTITFTGWTNSAAATAQYNTINANKFFVSVARINGTASLYFTALQ